MISQKKLDEVYMVYSGQVPISHPPSKLKKTNYVDNYYVLISTTIYHYILLYTILLKNKINNNKVVSC